MEVDKILEEREKTHGNFREIDHYRDIQGYTELIIKELEKN